LFPEIQERSVFVYRPVGQQRHRKTIVQKHAIERPIGIGFAVSLYEICTRGQTYCLNDRSRDKVVAVAVGVCSPRREVQRGRCDLAENGLLRYTIELRACRRETNIILQAGSLVQ
jgi:heterodisulfide reductase subunit A-like polyferredoxin